MRAVQRFFLRTAAGLGVLQMFSLLGLGIGVNMANALVVGFLGAPGLGLLLMGNVLI